MLSLFFTSIHALIEDNPNYIEVVPGFQPAFLACKADVLIKI